VGVEPKKFQMKMSARERKRLRAELGLKPDDFVMIYVAELIPRKNHKKLLEDFGGYLNCSQAHMLFVGDAGKSNASKKLKKMIGRKKLGGRVHFLGYRNDVPKLMAMADMAVSACLEEGLGLGVIEAKMAGLPVLMTDVRGHREIASRPIGDFALEKALKVHRKIYGL
jgi:glycosyltransferase EpsD